MVDDSLINRREEEEEGGSVGIWAELFRSEETFRSIFESSYLRLMIFKVYYYLESNLG